MTIINTHNTYPELPNYYCSVCGQEFYYKKTADIHSGICDKAK